MNSSSSPKDRKLHKILKDIEAQGVDYPEELLSARRAAFMEELAHHQVAETEEPSTSNDRKVIDLLRRLKSISEAYPVYLWSSRRAAFRRRIVWMNMVSMWTAFWSAMHSRVSFLTSSEQIALRRVLPTSLMAASFVLAAMAGLLFYENQNSFTNLFRSPEGIVKSALMVTTDSREVRIICKPGYEPPLCLAGEFNREEDLTFQGNGTARPAVAKDTAPGHRAIHQAAFLNDGLYGPGASWRSNSKNSWIKIDLGKVTPINLVKFGRDRLGELNDGDPGRFIIAVALTDNVYANGNNSNDDREYKVVYDSKSAGFKGTISGAETVTAQFDPLATRYIKITFQNKGTAVDEVEAFLVQPPVLTNGSDPVTKNKRTDDDDNAPTAVNTLIPVNTETPVPEDTSTPLPTFTLVPTNTVTPFPTSTPLPTFTATPLPTNTRMPTRTFTPIPTNTRTPTNTATPAPTNTRPPTHTATPVPTNTPLPTDTPSPMPTDTPAPTDTEVPPTDTPVLESWPPGSTVLWTSTPSGP